MKGRSNYLVGRAFRSFLFATVLTAAASQVGALIDGMMLSHFINPDAMSAINIVSPVNQVLYSLCILLGVGGTMLAGMAIGHHRPEEASDIFSQVLTATLLIGAALGLCGVIFMTPLVNLLCPDAHIQGYAADYLAVILPAAFIYMGMIVSQLFVTLDGEPRRVTLAVSVSMTVNLALDYIFIRFCGWGMTGAALATVASYLAAMIVLTPHFFKTQSLRPKFTRLGAQLGRVASMGLPFCIATMLIAVQLLGSNLIAIGYLGNDGIVTLSVCVYLLTFSMIILTGTLESFQPVAAILKGSGDNRGVALVLGNAYKFMCVCLLILALILIIFPDSIATLFGVTEPAARHEMELALPAYACNIILQSIVYLLIPVYQLYGHKRLALVISISQPLLPVAGFWALSAVAASAGLTALPWWGFALGQMIVAVVVIICSLRVKSDGEAGHYGVVLIPRNSADRIYDTSIGTRPGEMQQALVTASEWLKKHGVSEDLRVRIQVACEEIIGNVISHAFGGGKRHSSIDFRIAFDKNEIVAVVRDEGQPFNPVEQPDGSGIGLPLVRKAVDEMRYEYIFHQNQTTLTWGRHV